MEWKWNGNGEFFLSFLEEMMGPLPVWGHGRYFRSASRGRAGRKAGSKQPTTTQHESGMIHPLSTQFIHRYKSERRATGGGGGGGGGRREEGGGISNGALEENPMQKNLGRFWKRSRSIRKKNPARIMSGDQRSFPFSFSLSLFPSPFYFSPGRRRKRKKKGAKEESGDGKEGE